MPHYKTVLRLAVEMANGIKAIDPASPTFNVELDQLRRLADDMLAHATAPAKPGNPDALAALNNANRVARETRRIRHKRIRAVISELRAKGAKTWRQIGAGLIARGIHPTHSIVWPKNSLRAIERGSD